MGGHHHHSDDHDHHGHSHSHAHDFLDSDKGTRRLFIAIAVNVLLTVAQLVGGLLSGSLALLADALHNFGDAGALLVAWLARKISLRPADERRTYGYRRAEVLGALINATALLVIAVYLIVEAVQRFMHPESTINGLWVMALAGFALIIDLITVALTFSSAKTNLNMRAAYIHNLSDAMASVAVIISGLLIWLYQWYWVDLLATVIISLYIVVHGWAMIKQSVEILMEAVPGDLKVPQISAELCRIKHVENIHHVHVWQLDDRHRSLEAHVVVDQANLAEIENIKTQIREKLKHDFNIGHSTLEVELASDIACSQAGC